MTKKSMALKQISDYMAKKGKVLTLAEYNAETDTPIRSVMVKRIFGGSWARMEGMLKVAYPELYESPKPVIIQDPANTCLVKLYSCGFLARKHRFLPNHLYTFLRPNQWRCQHLHRNL